MPPLKRTLLSTIPAKDIPRLARNGEMILKRYRKSSTLYEQILLSSRKDVVSDDLIELVHKMVKAFGMNRLSVKLSELTDFKKSIIEQADTIQSLAKFKLEKVKETDEAFKKEICTLFCNLDGLNGLTKTNVSLVTFSKTMHFLLPNLFMPIDRRYTLQFYYADVPFKRDRNMQHMIDTREKQVECLFQIFEDFRQYAQKHHEKLNDVITKAKDNSNSHWNRNIPKVIDNIIIGYVTENMKK